MTDRLDRLEALAETTLLAIDQLRQRQEAAQIQIEQNRETALDAVQMSITLGQHFDEFQQDFRNFQQEMRDFTASINAHVERTDRILDYLVRRSNG